MTLSISGVPILPDGSLSKGKMFFVNVKSLKRIPLRIVRFKKSFIPDLWRK